jgi:hypothetical protein
VVGKKHLWTDSFDEWTGTEYQPKHHTGILRWFGDVFGKDRLRPDPIELTAAEFRSAGYAALRRWFGDDARWEFHSFEGEVGERLSQMTHRAVIAFCARCARQMQSRVGAPADGEHQAAVEDIINCVATFAAAGDGTLPEAALEELSEFALTDTGWYSVVKNAYYSTLSFQSAVSGATDSALITRGRFGARVVWLDLEAAFRASQGPAGSEGEPVSPFAFDSP